MNQPQPLSAFKDQILSCPKILDLIANHYGGEVEAALARFQAGNDDDLWDLIADQKRGSLEEFATSLMAAAPDDDVFEIEILSAGPVFWIRANEFEDIGYFGSQYDALVYAEDYFDPYISELADREEE
ncbi:MAG: hypothetical protein KGS60_10575 [Verrucomicrobia bacterium]|nr:hypothetical protein [Verrucomicrobiota bacterium]